LDGDNIVADAGTWLHSGEAGARCIVWAEASPGYTHLVGFLLEWAKARALHRLAELPRQLPKVIRMWVEEHRSTKSAAIEAAGFENPRPFVTMARPLSELPPYLDVPSGTEVVTWSDDLEESVRLASNASFADHWGSLPMSSTEFAGFYRDNPTFRPDLSFLAIAEGSVVSFSLCEVDAEDNEDRDTNDVFIHRVGTMRSHRGQGLASALMLRSMHAAASTGELDRAALDVDEMSHTNATLVYERLGFEINARALNYTITI
jgi:GNAT superfamily N-acetyltransferase